MHLPIMKDALKLKSREMNDRAMKLLDLVYHGPASRRGISLLSLFADRMAMRRYIIPGGNRNSAREMQ